MSDFSDDDFDDLNANALAELENTAIQFTQAQQKATQTQDTYQASDLDFEDDDLDGDTVIHDESLGQPIPVDRPLVQSSTRIVPQHATKQQNGWRAPAPIPGGHMRQQNSQSFGRPLKPQAEIAPRQSQSGPYSQMRPPAALPRPGPSIPSRYQASQASRQTAPSAAELSLQAQVRDLQLRLQAREGEVGIVRKNHEKYREEHERELQALKKQTAEQLLKKEREVEAARAAERTATTELEFTRRDMREELGRAKRKERDGGTPKKNNAAKAWGVSDGFEDVEVAGSPTKGARGRNTGGAVASVVVEPAPRGSKTPTKGKRKRQATMDSPVMALETTDDLPVFDGDNGIAATSAAVQPPYTAAPKKIGHVDFFKFFLNHSSAHGRALTFDVLAGFSLPSNQSESLASSLLQKLATIGDPSDSTRLPVEFCELLLDLWSRCWEEKYLEPITELVSLLTMALQLDTGGIAPHIAEPLISVATPCCFEVGILRTSNPGAGDAPSEEALNCKTKIPTTSILSLMYLTALGCATSTPTRGTSSTPIMDFWGSMVVEFVLTMLGNKQPVDDIIATVRLLSTSAFEDSIGPTTHAKRPLDEMASAVIDRVSFHLVGAQNWELNDTKLWTVRHAVLQTLSAFASSPYGVQQLGAHRTVIPRLVIFLVWSIDELYDGGLSTRSYVLSPPSTPPGEDGLSQRVLRPVQNRESLQTLIAHAMALLHTIITHPRNKDTVDVTAKVATFTGGPQKYLLSLARLNFAEDGVSEETADLARELLEMLVTEEEGAELGDFFGGSQMTSADEPQGGSGA